MQRTSTSLQPIRIKKKILSSGAERSHIPPLPSVLSMCSQSQQTFKKDNMNSHSINQCGGLSHLVEAASALTKLVENPPRPPITSTKVSPIEPAEQSEARFVVSDDECDTRKKKGPKASNNNNSLRSSREIFPQRLIAILSDSTLSDVISWLPHGRSFVIIRPDVFAERVLPKHLPSEKSSTKYPSFTRKLNRWGFRQATRGPDTGAFHHPLFCRDQPHLCLDMVCQKSRKRSSQAKKGDKKRAPSPAPSSSLTNKPNEPISPVPTASPSLPPKKRKMMIAAQAAAEGCVSTNTEAPSKPQQIQKRTSLSVVSNSGDDTSSETSSVNVPIRPVMLQNPVLMRGLTTPAQVSTPISQWVPNDPKLVAATLKAREEMEKLSAAKSMLFNAYIKALNGQKN